MQATANAGMRTAAAAELRHVVVDAGELDGQIDGEIDVEIELRHLPFDSTQQTSHMAHCRTVHPPSPRLHC